MSLNSFLDTIFIGYEKDIYAVLVYTIGIVIYSIFVWKFYAHLSRRDIIKFDLYKFDGDSPLKKLSDLISYFLKYLIMTPFVSAVWFIFMLFFLFILSKSQSVYEILIIGITLIGAIRISSYYNEELSKEIARVVPLTLLALFVIDPKIFSMSDVINRFNELPTFIPLIFRFLILFAVLEFVLRLFYEFKELITGDSS